MKQTPQEITEALAGIQSGALEMVYARPEPEKRLIYCTLRMIASDDEMHDTIKQLFEAEPDKLEQARAKPQLIGWFVGQAMRALKGSADPQRLCEIATSRMLVTGPDTNGVRQINEER
jgi:aspartyl-tRNA(Asn)/glutamyl-tRNA(Gln) amidotransferase subunit B